MFEKKNARVFNQSNWGYKNYVSCDCQSNSGFLKTNCFNINSQ